MQSRCLSPEKPEWLNWGIDCTKQTDCWNQIALSTHLANRRIVVYLSHDMLSFLEGHNANNANNANSYSYNATKLTPELGISDIMKHCHPCHAIFAMWNCFLLVLSIVMQCKPVS